MNLELNHNRSVHRRCKGETLGGLGLTLVFSGQVSTTKIQEEKGPILTIFIYRTNSRPTLLELEKSKRTEAQPAKNGNGMSKSKREPV